MLKIGIIGGTTPESTLYYYRLFIENSRKRLAKNTYPEIIIYSLNFGEFSDNPEGWEGRKKMLISAAHALEKAGAEIIAMSANTPHIVFDDVQRDVNVKMISIIDALAEESTKRGFRRLLLLGTKTTMSMPFYIEKLKERGIETIVPDDEKKERINQIIMNELSVGNFRSRDEIVRIIEKYSHVDAVILGCTELPLIIKNGDVSIPVLDTAAIHVEKIMDVALSKPQS